MALFGAGPLIAVSPAPDNGATLQEPFIVKLTQPSRRSLNLRAQLAHIKGVAQSEHLVVDRWFASEDGLIIRMRPSSYLDRASKESILQRLNKLPAVEFATTTSSAAGQLQPALFEKAFASDSEIPESRLRGFRDFDKAAHETRISPNAPRTKGILFVQAKEEALFGSAGAATRAQAAADHARLGGRVKEVLTDSASERSELIEFDEDQISIMDMIRRYHALPWVEYAEPQYSMFLLDTGVNDPYANGEPGYHLKRIQAHKAWDIKHDTNQIVAVIDTGIWFRVRDNGTFNAHPDLVGNNPARPRGNIFSDLSNTNFITTDFGPNDPFDDSGVWNQFKTATPEPNDRFSGGHGTHVAGIIGAVANNSIGPAGIAWTCQILPYRVFDKNELPRSAFDTDVLNAIDRAVAKQAKIINMSFGGPFAQKIADAVAGRPNTVRPANAQTAMVAAAGNFGDCAASTQTLEPSPTPGSGEPPGDGTGDPPPAASSIDPLAHGFPNNDIDPVYPASLPSPNLIAVANTIAQEGHSLDDSLHCSSSYGPFTIDLAAPGLNIVSTMNAQSAAAGLPYQYLHGTSMAAPHVSGTLALIRETFPQSTVWELLDRIRMGVDVVDALDGNRQPGQLRDFKGSVSTGGRLNAYRALLPRSKMGNVSCRAKVETGEARVINGFILRSNTTVVIRGIGPSLSNFGVSGPLADPYLELFNSANAVIAQNNNWKDTQQAAIQATGIPPTDDLESAIVIDLAAGAYTAQLTGVGQGQGIALTEVYELSPIADPIAAPDPEKDLKRTQNLSSRVMVRGGDQVAILGLIVTGLQPPNAATPASARRIMFRAIGPSLTALGVNNALADPKLQLFSNGVMIAENNNWKDADTMPTNIYRKKIEEATLHPSFDQESIIIATLPPGPYTVICSAADGGQGVALVEAYEY